MLRAHLYFTLIVTSLWLTGTAYAAEAAGPDPIPLWPQGAPGAQGEEPQDIPEIRLYPAPAESANGCCVVVLPGGGYGALATDHEGQQVARWLNTIGVTAAVVKYRLGPKYHHPSQLQDAQRALRYVRANAEDLKIDPHRVGIMGFSAGGHLASTVSTHFDDGDANSEDPVAQQSSRPDFSILCYPVISLTEEFAHRGSARNLLGESPDPELLKSLSNETQVTDQTPPTFLFHTGEDTGVPVENSLAYFQALRKHHVPAELHVYQRGPHGVGLAPGDPILNTWKERLADWLKTNGFLNNQPRAAAEGSVSLNGEPLRWGSITFQPAERQAPSASSMVSNGHFSFDKDAGPVVGENSVVVVSLGSVVPYPTIEDAQVFDESGLTATVTDQNNTFDFRLESRTTAGDQP